MVEESDEEDEMEGIMQTIPRGEPPFEDLCHDANFSPEEIASSEHIAGSWGLLDGRLLARAFYYLRSDIKSLTVASLTCKYWRAVARLYRNVTRQIDLSSLGPSCTDFVLRSIMVCLH